MWGRLTLAAVALFLGSCYQEAPRKQARPLSKLETRLANFIIAHRGPDPVNTAIVLAKAKRPRLMAAIACQESRFHPNAVGDGGRSKSMFQILGWHHGDPCDTRLALQVAEQHLDEKIKDARGNLWDGVRRYNGCGKQARLYRERVQQLYKEI